MERVIERLELDRDMLNGEMNVLGTEMSILNGDITELREDVECQNKELEDMIVALKIMNKTAKREPGLWAAKRPVCQIIMKMSESISELEEELKNKIALMEEKNDLLEDKLEDRNHIDTYLRVNARAAADSTAAETELLDDEDIYAIAGILTKEPGDGSEEEKLVG